MDIVERLQGMSMLEALTGVYADKSKRLDNIYSDAAAEIERLRGMLIFALDGLDEYWVTFPEGVELVNQIKALQQKEKE